MILIGDGSTTFDTEPRRGWLGGLESATEEDCTGSGKVGDRFSIGSPASELGLVLAIWGLSMVASLPVLERLILDRESTHFVGDPERRFCSSCTYSPSFSTGANASVGLAVPCVANWLFWLVLGNKDSGDEGIKDPAEGLEGGVAVFGRGIGSGGGEGLNLGVNNLVRLFCFFRGLGAIFMLPNVFGDPSRLSTLMTRIVETLQAGCSWWSSVESQDQVASIQ